jgi:5'-nucleotidase
VRRALRLLAAAIAVPLAAVALGACGGDDDDEAGPDTDTTETTDPSAEEAGCTTDETGPLQLVIVNDDGVINPAVDVLIDRLAEEDDLDFDVTVVAPADERSGSSDTTTPGGATYAEATTPGGNTAYSVDGYPADAVIVALDDLGLEPHLVVSGINPGQNFGTFASISGTVGAARTAIRRDVPALAVSAGPEFDQAQFEVGADLAVAWIEENCDALITREHQTDTLASINIPACAPEQMGPLQEVPRALEMPALPEGENIFASTCDLADPAPADDVAAVRSGYPSLTQVEADI